MTDDLVTVTTSKGSFTGWRDAVLAWLYETRPSYVRVLCRDGSSETVSIEDLPADLDYAIEAVALWNSNCEDEASQWSGPAWTRP